MLEGVRSTATWTTDKIGAVHELMAHTADHVRSCAPKIYSRELIELIFVQPYCRIQNMVDAGIGHRQTASVYLKSLVENGVLREEKVGREKLFIHPKYMQLLTGDNHGFVPYADARGGKSRNAHYNSEARMRAK